MTAPDVFDRLNEWGPVIRAAILAQGNGKKDNCIMSAKIALDILHNVGIREAFALSVRTSVFNAAFVARAESEGRLPSGHAEIDVWWEACRAWSVGLGILDYPMAPDRWPGHLAVVVNRKWLWDISIDQADRPERDIVFRTPVLLAIGERFLRGRERVAEMWGGMLLCYEARPQDKTFRATPDWRNSQGTVTTTRGTVSV